MTSSCEGSLRRVAPFSSDVFRKEAVFAFIFEPPSDVLSIGLLGVELLGREAVPGSFDGLLPMRSSRGCSSTGDGLDPSLDVPPSG